LGNKQDTIRIFSRSRSPLACCGIILLIFALLDLVVVIKLPTLNQVIALAQVIHYDLRHHPEVATMLTNINALVASIRFHMCVALIITRFWTFVVISFRIYASAPGVWGLVDGIVGVGSMWKGYGSSLVMDASSVDQLKNKVVLLYGAMETMFCFWVRNTYFPIFPMVCRKVFYEVFLPIASLVRFPETLPLFYLLSPHHS
jgi:hypothetical protein